MKVPVLYRIILTLQALADLEAIYACIAKDSPARAASVIEKVLDAIDSLEIFPHRNIVERQSAKVRYPIRSLPVKPFVIYFRVIDDKNVVIIRHIRHGARRRPSDLIERPAFGARKGALGATARSVLKSMACGK